jgi:hypothetical protein
VFPFLIRHLSIKKLRDPNGSDVEPRSNLGTTSLDTSPTLWRAFKDITYPTTGLGCWRSLMRPRASPTHSTRRPIPGHIAS